MQCPAPEPADMVTAHQKRFCFPDWVPLLYSYAQHEQASFVPLYATLCSLQLRTLTQKLLTL